MTHFEGGDQWNFGMCQKKKLRSVQIIFKKNFKRGEFYLQFWKQRTKIEVHKKKNLTQSGSNLTEVNFDVTYEGHQNCSKTHFMNILTVFGDVHIRPKNCPCQVWTSLYQVLFFWNLKISWVFFKLQLELICEYWKLNTKLSKLSNFYQITPPTDSITHQI